MTISTGMKKLVKGERGEECGAYHLKMETQISVTEIGLNKLYLRTE